MFNSVQKFEYRLAVIMGFSLSFGLAPRLYFIYFEKIGWPYHYQTHQGPLRDALIGDLLCWGNIMFFCILPLLTLNLAKSRLRIKRDFFTLVFLILPFAQIVSGIYNFVLLLALLD
jgi:hypothetical protein